MILAADSGQHPRTLILVYAVRAYPESSFSHDSYIKGTTMIGTPHMTYLSKYELPAQILIALHTMTPESGTTAFIVVSVVLPVVAAVDITL